MKLNDGSAEAKGVKEHEKDAVRKGFEEKKERNDKERW